MGGLTRFALLWASCLATALGAGTVVINEIHYAPVDKTVPEEFIELHNWGAETVDCSGWFFSAGVKYVFPEGALILPGGYLVIAQDPGTLAQTMGCADAFGPYEGRLANEGETLCLRDPSGAIQDTVDYRSEFPWPIAANGRGSSLELQNPTSENDVGGAWRASGYGEVPPFPRRMFVEKADAQWSYRKGTSEASTPPGAWRALDFHEDFRWASGRTPIGFGGAGNNTVLTDMLNGYTCVFLRREFLLPVAAPVPDALKLALYVDDGAIVWINGMEVLRVNMQAGDIPYDGRAAANRDALWQEFFLRDPAAFLRPGRNVIAVQAFNYRIGNSDFTIDAALFAPGSEDYNTGAPLPPTPGARNTVFTANSAPFVRKVETYPAQPAEGDDFLVTAMVTDSDGVASVTLRYQIVLPGQYVPARLPLPFNTLLATPTKARDPNPAFEDPANWTEIPMVDDGTRGDAVPGDGIFTATVPGQINRTLFRYRITATDAKGAAVTVPYQDDKSLNFACFVYNGVPAYTAATRSVHPDGKGHVYGEDVMRSLPVYFLITRSEDYSYCLGYATNQIPKSNEAARDAFNWEGAFVYDGKVYDHIKYRLRQANDRYGLAGKRSFRFRFNRGNFIRCHDNYGRPYPVAWRTLNTGKMFDNLRVGNFGLTETINFALWNLVGVPAPWVYTFHYRVIQRADEAPAGANGQYYGDFHGMANVYEDYDARFIDTHGLADGNLYKLKDGIFDPSQLMRNQGRYAVKNGADFQNIRANLRPTQTPNWLNAHVNYEVWYRYHAVVEGIRHYDFVPADSHSKNRAWYFEPDYSQTPYGRLWTLPWDTDASWGPNWNNGIDYSKAAIWSGVGREPFRVAYRNNMREFRDLVWTEEVIERMIDDLAERIRVFAMADRDRWRAAPAAVGTQDLGAMETKVADMKRFAFVSWSGSTGPAVPQGGRALYLDQLAAAEGDAGKIPATPAAFYTGPEGFPMDALTFAAGDYSDPQNDPFGAMRWRLGAITPPGAPFDPAVPRVYEVPAVWEAESTAYARDVTIPMTVVVPGTLYRVRVKMMDATGRWSHWSQPVEFTAGPPLRPPPQVRWLRVTEIMYHPLGDSAYEFIEIQNIGPEAVDLHGVRFDGGIRFKFADSPDSLLGPGEHVVVVKDRAVFATRYRTAAARIAGQYKGRLNNAGERIVLAYGAGLTILDFRFSDAWYPSTDGGGYSLVLRDPSDAYADLDSAEAWRPSHRLHGSPGESDDAPEGGLQLPGDINQDGRLTVADPVALLRILFGYAGAPLPCGDGTFEDPGNRAILDINGNGRAGIEDAVALLGYLFAGGPPPALGTTFVPIPGCPDVLNADSGRPEGITPPAAPARAKTTKAPLFAHEEHDERKVQR